ncbi:MAG: HAD-IIIC family phosphatase [Magnetococcales bacterium]|nr:HAD-IIIC family phosphatase [Magnetococcales bacterium]
MEKKSSEFLLISDFNMEILAGYLRNHPEKKIGSVRTAPFGQFMQILSGNMDYTDNHSTALVWTRPESVSNNYRQAKEFVQVPVKTVLEEVDHFADILTNYAQSVKTLFVSTWVTPRSASGYGMLDMRDGVGLKNLLMQMNLRLAEKLSLISNIYILDADRWFSGLDESCFEVKMWYLSKVPFGNSVFKEAADDVVSALTGLYGESRKLIVLDLDDTLWGGIVGDDGWDKLRLGGHDGVGEAFVDFQHGLKNLTRKGILLAIVSKNTESIAIEAIEKHPEMVLKLNDFAGWRINWNDKAVNIADLTQELNLGLQSVVFIDDNPVERARVRDEFPEVIVPEWPKNKMAYRSTLDALKCFNLPSLSAEDSGRTQMYVAERKRRQTRKSVKSLDDWLETLAVSVTIEPLDVSNQQRCTQLLNKTNQMNLTTRRLTEEQLVEWSQGSGRIIHLFSVSDKFGDSGLTGIASMEITNGIATVVDFILSCRVMGKKIEHTMTAQLLETAKKAGAKRMIVNYIKTAKNAPCLAFWKQSGFENAKHHVNRFEWNIAHPYQSPKCVRVENKKAKTSDHSIQLGEK